MQETATGTAIVSMRLPRHAAQQFEQTARDCGLRKTALMRLVLTRWLADPDGVIRLTATRGNS